MNLVIEPEQKHEVRANVEVRKQVNNRLLANVQVPANFERVQHIAAAEAEAVGPIEETDTNKINKAKNVYNKCVQVLNKIGFPQEQGQQLCQLLTETMIIEAEEEQESEQGNPPGKPPAGTPSGNKQQEFPISGQIASSTCAKTASLNKEIAIKKAIIQRQEKN